MNLPQAWKSSVVDDVRYFFMYIGGKCNIVKIYECPEYEFFRDL